MNSPPSISGFTIVRNALRLHYPFRESVESVLPLCEEFIINCGDSDDGTRELCAELAEKHPKIRVIDSVWIRENQVGGYQLKHQSDQALAACRFPWCFYIQADEVFHEADTPKIQAALVAASKNSHVDGIVFDYLHFYGNYSYTIQGRNWYRREVRLFKNGRGIEAFRDAQGFRKNGRRLKAIKSGARIFHYGYVRTSDSLKTKSQEMSGWWGETPKIDNRAIQLKRHVGIRPFRGTHPATMREPLKHNPPFDPKNSPQRWDKDEIKNALTLIWEAIVPYRIGEFRNYDLI